MSEQRRVRWRGDPREAEQPDVGDVLVYARPGKPDWYHLVHSAIPVRGGGAHDLWLMVTRHDHAADGSIEQPVADAILGAKVFPAHQRRRKARR